MYRIGENCLCERERRSIAKCLFSSEVCIREASTLSMLPLFPDPIAIADLCAGAGTHPSLAYHYYGSIGLPKAAELIYLTANRIPVCHPADGGHGHHVREDIFFYSSPPQSPSPSSSVPSFPYDTTPQRPPEATKHLCLRVVHRPTMPSTS